MTDFKGAIFDLDGTILDSMDVWEQIDIEFLGKRGFQVPDDYINAISPMGFEKASEYTIERFGLNETPEDIILEWYSMAIDAYSNSVFIKPYVKEYLLFLKQKGVKIALATASDEKLFIPALKNNKIFDLFDCFTSVKEVPRGKGSPDIYIKAASKLKLSVSDCAVFEDISAGIRGAKAGGFYTIGVYDKRSDYERELIINESDIYIKSFLELID